MSEHEDPRDEKLVATSEEHEDKTVEPEAPEKVVETETVQHVTETENPNP